MSETTAAVKMDKGCLRDLARPTLSALAEQLEQAIPDELNNYSLLHDARLVGKQFRYSLEVLAVCFSSAMREENKS